jgi:hypothetical protein
VRRRHALTREPGADLRSGETARDRAHRAFTRFVTGRYW